MALATDLDFSRFLSISRAIAGQLDYGAVLQAFADELSHLIQHDHMDIVLLAKDGEQHTCYEVGLHTAWSELADAPGATALSPIRSVLWGDAGYLLTDDALSDGRFHFDGAFDEPIFSAELRSRVVVPLRVQGGVIGAINISSHLQSGYDRRHVAIAQQCADLIAPYFFSLSRAEEARKAAIAEGEARAREKMLRTGALHLTTGMERERQRLAMDLHDQTMADLAHLARRIARFRRNGMATSSDLAALDGDVTACLDELRRTVEDMKPGVLHLFGFCEAVEAHLVRSVSAAEPPIDISVSDVGGCRLDRLPEAIQTALYRIVQEAINNAVRHARGRHVDVRVIFGDDRLTVAVSDDGRGFREDRITSSGGLSHMRTRAALIGAALTVGPNQDGRGSVIEVTIPFPSDLREQESERRAAHIEQENGGR